MTSVLFRRFCRILDDEKHFYPMLTNEEIFSWVFEDLDYLRSFDKNLKNAEDKWGKNMLKRYWPQYQEEKRKQWTNKFGENLCKEYLQLIGKENIESQKKKDGSQPDFLTKNEIWEVKTGTYYTSGTAHDKIASVPWNYGGDMKKFEKSALMILCIGGAEKYSRNKLGIFPGPKQTEFRKLELAHWKSKNIHFISLKDALASFINEKSFVV